MINRFGYACINVGLRKKKVKVNRKMIRKTFLEKGPDYAGQLALQNILDMRTILQWNVSNGILGYRMSSSMFPWMSEYEIQDLKHFDQIQSALQECGQIARDHDLRLTFHPGAFTILSSPKPSVVDKAIKELNQHSQIMDLMQLSVSRHNKINIHVGGAYGDKPTTLRRFCQAFKRLDANTQARLTVENDDRPSLYTVEDLMAVYHETGIPIVFDFHHHDCHPGQLSKTEAYELALTTWPDDIVPVVHMSSSRQLYEDRSAKAVAHADYLYEEIPTGSHKVDVLVEAKAKELAIINYLMSKHKPQPLML